MITKGKESVSLDESHNWRDGSHVKLKPNHAMPLLAKESSSIGNSICLLTHPNPQHSWC